MMTLSKLIQKEGMGAIGRQASGAKRYLAFSEEKGWYLTKEYNLLWRICRYTLGLFFGSCSPFSETHKSHLKLHEYKWQGKLSNGEKAALNQKIKGLFAETVVEVQKPSGINNSGTTCWLNASLQVILSSKRAKEALSQKESTPLIYLMKQAKLLLQCGDRAEELREIVLKMRALLSDDPEVSEGQSDPTNPFSTLLEELGLGVHTLETISRPEVIGLSPKTNEASNVMVDICFKPDEKRVNLSTLLERFRTIQDAEGALEFEGRNGRIKLSQYTQEYRIKDPLPDLLAVRALRFTCKNGEVGRLDTKIDIDKEEMDLGFLCEGKQSKKYRLVGMVKQTGEIHSGHYVAYIKNEQGYWLKCDDSSVTVSHISEMGEGYIYLFEKI